MKAEESGGRGGRGRAHIGRARSAIARAAIAALALLAMAVCGGCIWLAIPSLAYQGYKAEEPANQNGQTKPRDNSQQQSQGGSYQYE